MNINIHLNNQSQMRHLHLRECRLISSCISCSYMAPVNLYILIRCFTETVRFTFTQMALIDIVNYYQKTYSDTINLISNSE